MSELANSINNFRPLYFYEIYEVNNVTHGRIIDWVPAWEAEKRFSVVFKFEGKTASYWIGTEELSFVRDDALQFAVAVHEGSVSRYNCDLRPLNQ